MSAIQTSTMSRDLPYTQSDVKDYERVAQVIAYLHAHRPEQPDLDRAAEIAGLSKFHFQKLFVRWAGVSPKQFLDCLNVAHAKRLLRHDHSVLDTALATGLSGPGRLHDLFIKLEAMSPGEYRALGDSLVIRYGVHATPYGEALLATTERGICGLHFLDDNSTHHLQLLQSEWPLSRLVADQAATGEWLARVVRGDPATLLVRGSRLQVQVWRALLRIPSGSLSSYGEVANAIGHHRAARAVGTAIGRNPVAWLIPCHRVIRATGEFEGYRWGGAVRKQAMIAREVLLDGPGQSAGA